MSERDLDDRIDDRPTEKDDVSEAPEEAGRADRETLEEIQRLCAERDDYVAKYQRALADFRNFQRRSALNEQYAREQGMADVIRALLPALENLDIAVTQEASTPAEVAMREGMHIVRNEFLKALAGLGARRIKPKPGDEFDPRLHEAMLHEEVEGVESDRVASSLQVGYAIGDIVLRPAKVSLAK